MKTNLTSRARCSHLRAFTFIEIMLVVLIIGILMAVVVPRMVSRTRIAKINAAKMSLQGIKTALSTFEVKAGRFPTTQEGLAALVERPSNLKDDEWDGPYLQEVPQDPWHEGFIYRAPGDVSRDYDIICKGPDKQENSGDDIASFTREAAAPGSAS